MSKTHVTGPLLMYTLQILTRPSHMRPDQRPPWKQRNVKFPSNSSNSSSSYSGYNKGTRQKNQPRSYRAKAQKVMTQYDIITTSEIFMLLLVAIQCGHLYHTKMYTIYHNVHYLPQDCYESFFLTLPPNKLGVNQHGVMDALKLFPNNFLLVFT